MGNKLCENIVGKEKNVFVKNCNALIVLYVSPLEKGVGVFLCRKVDSFRIFVNSMKILWEKEKVLLLKIAML